MSNVTGIQYMVPVGMYNRYSASVIAGACINFCCNWMMIPKYGAYGAIIASVIAECSVTVIQYISIRRKVNINFKNRSYLIYIIGALLMMAAVYYTGILVQNGFTSTAVIGNTNHYSLVDVVTTIVQVLVGMAVYYTVLRVTREELLMKVLNKAKEKRHASA